MSLFLKPWIAATLAVAFFASASPAVAQQKPEELLKMRQGLMQSIKMQAGPLLGYAQDKNPLPADVAVRAAHLVSLARLSPTAWAKGSESLPDAKTKPEAFTSPDFMKGWDAMQVEASKLALLKADSPDLKAQIGALGKTCKGCHDSFKKD